MSERLAACVHVAGPIASTYRWQGKVEQADEWTVTAKTTRERAAAVVRRLKELHSYTQPEILVVPVLDADPGYAAWVAEEVTPAEREAGPGV